MSWALTVVDPALFVRVSSILGGFGIAARTSMDPRDPPAFVVVDDANLEVARTASPNAAAPVVVVAEPLSREAVASALELPRFTALVASRASDFAAALERVALELTSNMEYNTSPPALTMVVHASTERETLLQRIESTLSDAGVRSRVMSRAVSALEELITNAVYDAPTDASGHALHLTTDRRTPVTMPEGAYPTLSLGVTDGRIHASMSDPFGSLSADSFKTYLARGLRGDFADKAGGAGLGFARIYAAVDELHVRVKPGVSTRVSVALDASAPRRDPGARPNGLFVLERA